MPTKGHIPWHCMKASFPTITDKGGLGFTGRLWMVLVNFRVLGDVLSVRAWGDK